VTLLLTLLIRGQISGDTLSRQSILLVQEFEFVGNTVFSDEELLEIAAPYLQQELASEKLLELKNKITQHYIDHGYINSGAILPDQEIKAGIIRYEIKEGTLQDIRLLEKGHFTTHYLLSRIRRNNSEVLNIFDLQEALKLLEQDGNVQTVQATLEPGDEPGTSSLLVSVEESKHFDGRFSFDNYNPASVGSYAAKLSAESNNLTGWGEALGVILGWRMDDDLSFRSDENVLYDLSFSVPVTRWDTRLSASYNNNLSNVVSEGLSGLDIENESENFTLGLRHPVFKDLKKEFSLSLRFNHKKAETRILDIDFLIAPVSLSSLSFGQDLVYRTAKDVFVVYSNFDFGVDAFISDGDEPINAAGEETIDFVTWLLQVQYLRRLQLLDSQLLLKASTRLADRAVPATEKFQIGGHSTVRGYRENTFTLDEAFLFSGEYQVPFFKLKVPHISKDAGDGQMRLSIFYDYAIGEDKETSGPTPTQEISSTGLGLDWRMNATTYAKVLWGLPFRKIDFTNDSDLQDAGIHVEFSAGF